MCDLSWIVFEDNYNLFMNFSNAINLLEANNKTANNSFLFFINGITETSPSNSIYCKDETDATTQINSIISGLGSKVIILLDLYLNGVYKVDSENRKNHFLFPLIQNIANNRQVHIISTSSDEYAVSELQRQFPNITITEPGRSILGNPSSLAIELERVWNSLCDPRKNLEEFLNDMSNVDSDLCHIDKLNPTKSPEKLENLAKLLHFADLAEMETFLALKDGENYLENSSAVEVLKNFSKTSSFSILSIIFVTFLAYRDSLASADIIMFKNILILHTDCNSVRDKLVAVKQSDRDKFNKVVLAFYDMMVKLISKNHLSNFEGLSLKIDCNYLEITFKPEQHDESFGIDPDKLFERLRTWQDHRIIPFIEKGENSQATETPVNNEGNHITAKAIFKFLLLSTVGEFSLPNLPVFGAHAPLRLYKNGDRLEMKFFFTP